MLSTAQILYIQAGCDFSQGLHYSFQTKDRLYFVLDYVNGGEVSVLASAVCFCN